MKRLEEGIYAIPDDCTVYYSGRKVRVQKMKHAHSTAVNRCRDCIYQKLGKVTMSRQWWTSEFCMLKPKTISGREGFYYAAPNSRPACDKFEPKYKESCN